MARASARSGRCLDCDVELPDKRRVRCVSCRAEYKRTYQAGYHQATKHRTLIRRKDTAKRYRERHQDRVNAKARDHWHAHARFRQYGMTREQFDAMVEAQSGLCLICEKPPGVQGLHIDHNHESGQVRGLLCEVCNKGLGCFRDDPELLYAALRYLGQPVGRSYT